MNAKIKPVVPILFFVLLLHGVSVWAEKTAEVITIKVEGLYCPFCAYGLEKQLKKLDGYQKVEVNLKHGVAELYVDSSAAVSDDAIQKAVEDAGFDSASIKRDAKKEVKE